MLGGVQGLDKAPLTLGDLVGMFTEEWDIIPQDANQDRFMNAGMVGGSTLDQRRHYPLLDVLLFLAANVVP